MTTRGRSEKSAPPVMTAEAFKVLGGGIIAYIKTVRSEDMHRLYADAPEMSPGQTLWVLHAADGTPILVTDTREGAIANARAHNLDTVGLH